MELLPSAKLLSWRIKDELDSSRFRVSTPVLVGLFFCPSLVFVGVGPAKFLGMLVCQFGRPGWFLGPTFSGGLHPLLGVLYTDVLGLILFVVSDSFYTGEEMAVGHLARPVRSTSTRHVGFPDMLLLVPLQNCEVASSERCPASGLLLWPPVTRNDRKFLTKALL